MRTFTDICCFATSYGKSIIYAVLPLVFDFMFGRCIKGLLNA